MIRILHVLTSGLVGGTEKMTIRLIRGMDPARFTNHAAFFRNSGPIGEELQSMGVPVAALQWSPARTLAAASQLAALLRRERYDIVQCYGAKANMLVRPVSRLCRVPVFITAQRSVDLDRRLWHSLGDRLTSGWVTLYLSNTQAAAQLLQQRERIPAQKIRTVHNGIDCRPFAAAAAQRPAVRKELGLGPGDVCLGWIGRTEPVKGLDVLVEALAKLPAELPLRTVIVGEGSQGENLMIRAAEVGIGGDRLRFLGMRSDIPRLLAAMDLFVLPSRWEGLPGAIMEAMCAGLPVVSSRIGGIPELVADGQTGLLIPPGDPAALAEAIRTLAEDEQLRQTFGAAGKARILQEFSLEQMISRTEAIYAELAGRS